MEVVKDLLDIVFTLTLIELLLLMIVGGTVGIVCTIFVINNRRQMKNKKTALCMVDMHRRNIPH